MTALKHWHLTQVTPQRWQHEPLSDICGQLSCLSVIQKKMSNRAQLTGHDLIVRLPLSLLPGMCRRPHQEEACSLAEDFKSASAIANTHRPMYKHASTYENTHTLSRFLTSSESNSAPRATQRLRPQTAHTHKPQRLVSSSRLFTARWKPDSLAC